MTSQKRIPKNGASPRGKEKIPPFRASRRERERNQRVLSQGAEAIIYKINDKVIKDRIPKSYRIPELDDKIRRQRTKAEYKILEKASKIINVPKPLTDPKSGRMIHLPYIQGKKLSQHLDEFPLTKQKQIMQQLGQDIAKIHKENIIHGDLTTSNVILYSPSKKAEPVSKTRSPKGSEIQTLSSKKIASNSEPIIFLIDFGLGFQNGKYEDKAVDIHLLKQALEAKHWKKWETLFHEFLKGYKKNNKTDSEKVLNQLNKVEKRGRYRH